MNKADFFKKAKLNSSILDLPDIGKVEVKELTLAQRLMVPSLNDEGEESARIKVIIMGCDMFNDDDFEQLCNVKSGVLIKMFSKIMTLSGVGGDKAKKG